MVERATAAEPYIAWVKEGRKYDLGSVLITQQPGSIPVEILSQGDNWFIFHLLSGADLGNVRSANAHFSNDLLSALLNEPIPGHGVFWSSVGGTPYPISVRVLSFEKMHPPLDPEYGKPAARTYARTLREEFERTLEEVGIPSGGATSGDGTARYGARDPAEAAEIVADGGTPAGSVDVVAAFERRAIEALRGDQLLARISGEGAAYGSLKAFLKERLPDTLEDRDTIAYFLVAKAMNEILGRQDEAWHTFRNEERRTTWVRAGRNPNA